MLNLFLDKRRRNNLISFTFLLSYSYLIKLKQMLEKSDNFSD